MVLPKEEESASKINLDHISSNPCNSIDSCVVPKLMPSSLHFKIQVKLKGLESECFSSGYGELWCHRLIHQ